MSTIHVCFRREIRKKKCLSGLSSYLDFYIQWHFNDVLGERRNIWLLPHDKTDKTNQMTCAPNAGSDQPGHPPSLIRVFAGRSMGSYGPKLFFSFRQRKLNRLARCPGWSESSLSVHVILLVLWWDGSFHLCIIKLSYKKVANSSRKHTYIILTPLNPTFI